MRESRSAARAYISFWLALLEEVSYSVFLIYHLSPILHGISSSILIGMMPKNAMAAANPGKTKPAIAMYLSPLVSLQ
ncbi:hypothetical protein BJX62DRAFT_148689 [Aspergillus germanicus]